MHLMIGHGQTPTLTEFEVYYDPSAKVSASTGNLASGKVATASSQWDTVCSAAMANDEKELSNCRL